MPRSDFALATIPLETLIGEIRYTAAPGKLFTTATNRISYSSSSLVTGLVTLLYIFYASRGASYILENALKALLLSGSSTYS